MVEQDTIKLLRECDAGTKMGISSIDDVIDKVKSDSLMQYLADCRNRHVRLEEEIQVLLENYQDDGKEPALISEAMSHMKTAFKLAVEKSDETIADLMTDGCNMGVKSLNKYLNQYEAASEKAKDICKKLIALEEELCKDIKSYL